MDPKASPGLNAPFPRHLLHTQRRFYNSRPHRQLPGGPNTLPFTFMAICCTGYAFSLYAHDSAPHLLRLIDDHAVCSLQNIREGRYYTLVTSSFTHFTLVHLGFNMYGLYMLGPLMTSFFGPSAFLVLWIGSSLTCDAAALYWDYLNQQARQARSQARAVRGVRQVWGSPEAMVETKSIGASGSVLGMFATFCCMMPKNRVLMMPIPVPVPAWVGISVFAIGSAYCAVNALFPYIGHMGHLGGMAFGAAWYFTQGRRILRKLGRF
ncbi:hypothetical protein G7Y79_00016g040380 [Physcia stellaris]|nr:hypothetical protein G7Y79_00016g040380 [Physcia stellaris]